MAGQTSLYGALIRMNPQGIGNDAAMSSAKCVTVAQNLNHLRDMYPQYRVNQWAVIPGPLTDLAGDGVKTWVHEFPVTLRADGKPCSLDVRVAAACQSGTVDIEVLICRAEEPYPATATIGDTIPTGSTSSATGAWAIDDQIHFTNVKSVRITDVPITDGDFVTRSTSQEVRLRVEITFTASGGAGEDLFYLGTVQIREFVGDNSIGF